MSSRGKKKTTMAKLSREARLRERRVEKAARKEARRAQALEGPEADIYSPELEDSELTAESAEGVPTPVANEPDAPAQASTEAPAGAGVTTRG